MIKTKFKPLACALVLLGLSQVVFASNETIEKANEITLSNNDNVSLSMSANQMNRIYVNGDLISNVNCPAGFCEIAHNKDDPNGSLYIKFKTQEAFTYYISTHNGYHFGIQVTPKLTDHGDTVAFNLIGGSAKSLLNTKNSNYADLIIKRMKSLIRQESSDNWVYRSVQSTKENTLTVHGIEIKPISIYQGQELTGFISEITNTTNKPQAISENLFYVTGNRAIALNKSSLAPHESGKLYVIK